MRIPKFRSWLGALNYFVLQWTGYRLGYYLEDGKILTLPRLKPVGFTVTSVTKKQQQKRLTAQSTIIT